MHESPLKCLFKMQRLKFLLPPSCKSMYWVSQKVSLVFPIKSYGKKQNELFGQPYYNDIGPGFCIFNRQTR